MARPTNTKTRSIQRQLQAAGFTLVRNPAGHEIGRLGPLWVRIAAGHREVEASVLARARRVLTEATARRQGG
jgi:hypothetical protein